MTTRPILRPRSPRRPSGCPSPARERGVALAVVLILLLVMTLLALAATRGTLMQERMGAGRYDRSLAFHAAEAALREAETNLAAGVLVATGADADCTTGVCNTPVPGSTPRWESANWTSISTEASAADLGSLAIKPRYIVEYMGLFDSLTCTNSQDVSANGCTQKDDHYRITARSAASGRADVMLQSNFIVPHVN